MSLSAKLHALIKHAHMMEHDSPRAARVANTSQTTQISEPFTSNACIILSEQFDTYVQEMKLQKNINCVAADCDLVPGRQNPSHSIPSAAACLSVLIKARHQFHITVIVNINETISEILLRNSCIVIDVFIEIE